MDLNGLLNVSSAQLLIPVVEKAVEASADEKTADKDTKMTDAPADAAAADSEKAADTKMDTTADTAAPAAEAEAKPVQPPKKKMKRVDLVVEGFSLGGLSKKTLEAFHEKEVSMCNNDRIVKETNDAMNALESYALEMRSRIQDDYDLAPFCTSDLRESFTAMLRKMEDWLYDEGFDCQKSEYVRRLTEVTAVGNPIEARKLEESKRSGYISDLKALIGRYQQFVTSTDKKYEHITAEERAEVQKLSDEADAWLTQSIIAQDALLKSVDPVLTLKAMTDKAAWLNNKAGPIVNKKAPPPPPKEEPKKEEEDKENKSAEANTQAPAADAAADAAAKPEEATTDADAAAKADAPAADADMSEKSAEAPAADADADAAMDTATE